MLATTKEKRAPRGVGLILCAVAALLAVIAANVNLNPVEPAKGLSPFLSAVDSFCRSFPNANRSVLHIIEWCGAFVLLRQAARHRLDAASLVVAALFSLAMVLGYPIQETGTLAMLCDGPVQVIKAILCFAGYLALSYGLVRILFAALDSATRGEASAKPARMARVLGLLDRHPLALPFLALLIAWMPLIVGYAPGLFMGDTNEQLCMWLGLDNARTQTVNLISPDVTMTQHFPPIHTALFGLFVQMGVGIFGNPNAGVLCYTVFQTGIVLLCVSYAHTVALRLGAHPYARAAVLALFAFTPWYAGYAIMVTRDTIFAALLLVFCLQLLVLARQPESRAQTGTWVLLAASGILAALFRSGGIAMVAAGLVVLVVLMRKDPSRAPLKASVIASCAVVAVTLSVTNVLYPALAIPSGNVAEMLSIPFQQTARFVKEHPGELDRWEVEAVDAVLAYGGLAGRYVPATSDKVKDYAATYRHNVTPEQWGNYVRAYLAMGLRDPGCYALATMNNYYGYFYPAKNKTPFYTLASSERRMVKAKVYTGLDFHHPKNLLIRGLAEIDTAYIEVFRATPILSLLMKSFAWMWVLILATAYAIRRRWVHAAPILATLWMLALIFLAGPCNGSNYNRYVYPLAVALPFLLIALPTPKATPAKR